VIAGAALGALFGALRRRRPNRRHARAGADTSAILVVVRTRSQDQLAVVRRLLVESGGRDVTVED
jgi:hypothetical protein